VHWNCSFSGPRDKERILALELFLQWAARQGTHPCTGTVPSVGRVTRKASSLKKVLHW